MCTATSLCLVLRIIYQGASMAYVPGGQLSIDLIPKSNEKSYGIFGTSKSDMDCFSTISPWPSALEALVISNREVASASSAVVYYDDRPEMASLSKTPPGTNRSSTWKSVPFDLQWFFKMITTYKILQVQKSDASPFQCIVCIARLSRAYIYYFRQAYLRTYFTLVSP